MKNIDKNGIKYGNSICHTVLYENQWRIKTKEVQIDLSYLGHLT